MWWRYERYTMDGVPRGDAVAARIAEQYLPVAAIERQAPDLLIVTGSNPIEKRIEDEPYWSEMVDLLTWASDTSMPCCSRACRRMPPLTSLMAWSGSDFPQNAPVSFSSRLTKHIHSARGLDTGDRTPALANQYGVPGHSRAMQATTSPFSLDAEGWAVAAREIGHANVVLVQGHPEYDPSSLLREYHRDARRYVHHEQDALPVLPLHCVAPQGLGWSQEVPSDDDD